MQYKHYVVVKHISETSLSTGLPILQLHRFVAPKHFTDNFLFSVIFKLEGFHYVKYKTLHLSNL
jgi:hypothetical protein